MSTYHRTSFIIGSASFLAMALFLDNPTLFGVCFPYHTANGSFCSSPYGYPYGVTLLPFSIALLGASILAFFTSRATFKRWGWFTLWYGIIATLLMLIVPNIGINGGFVSLPLVELHVFAQMLAWLYGGISVLLLGVSEVLGRRKGKEQAKPR